MSTIGVIGGVGNNSFDPNGTLTREQAAKLIAYMLLGENSEKLGVEGTSFNNVAATRWSAPAIEYCASLGIIAGDGNFCPAGKLTGYAFAKMLLTAIGDRELLPRLPYLYGTCTCPECGASGPLWDWMDRAFEEG